MAIICFSIRRLGVRHTTFKPLSPAYMLNIGDTTTQVEYFGGFSTTMNIVYYKTYRRIFMPFNQRYSYVRGMRVQVSFAVRFNKYPHQSSGRKPQLPLYDITQTQQTFPAPVCPTTSLSHLTFTLKSALNSHCQVN